MNSFALTAVKSHALPQNVFGGANGERRYSASSFPAYGTRSLQQQNEELTARLHGLRLRGCWLPGTATRAFSPPARPPPGGRLLLYILNPPGSVMVHQAPVTFLSIFLFLLLLLLNKEKKKSYSGMQSLS